MDTEQEHKKSPSVYDDYMYNSLGELIVSNSGPSSPNNPSPYNSTSLSNSTS